MYATPFIPPPLPLPQAPMPEPSMVAPPPMAPALIPPPMPPAPVLPPVAPMPEPSVSKSEKAKAGKFEAATRLMRSAQDSYKTPDMGPSGTPLPNPSQAAGNMPQAMSLKSGWGGGQ